MIKLLFLDFLLILQSYYEAIAKSNREHGMRTRWAPMILDERCWARILLAEPSQANNKYSLQRIISTVCLSEKNTATCSSASFSCFSDSATASNCEKTRAKLRRNDRRFISIYRPLIALAQTPFFSSGDWVRYQKQLQVEDADNKANVKDSNPHYQVDSK